MGTGTRAGDAAAAGTGGAAPDRARSRPVAWACVGLLGVLGSLGFAAVDAPPADDLGTVAERFLPADGAAATLTLSTGEQWIVETAISVGTSAALQQPGVPGEQLLGSLLEEGGDAAATGARFVRQLLTDASGSLPQITELSTIGADGLRLRTVTGTPNGFVYTPGVLVLPATVHPGSTWRSSGEALPQQLLAYRHEASAAAAPASAGDGCLVVDSTIVYTDPQAADAELLRVLETSTWCPGLGVVASEATVETPTAATGSAPDAPTSATVASTTVPGVPGAGIPGAGAGTVLTAATSWPSTAGWVASEPAFVIADPLFGESELPHPVAAPAAATADGTTVLVVDDELEAWVADGDRQVRRWVAHPGGTIVALGAVGDLVIATTSTRQVVAYTADGQRRWSADFDDIVLDAPIADGEGGLVAVALDGEVRSLDADDGRERWSASIGSDAEAGAVLVDDLVIVGGRDGGVLGLDRRTGDSRWRAQTDPVGALGAVGGTVVVAATDGGVTALDAADGSIRWADARAGIVERLAAAGDVAVGLHADGLTAWSADGRVVWSADGVDEGLVGDGEVVVALTGERVLALDATGATVAEWPTTTPWGGVTRTLLATRDGVWVVRSDHGVTAIGMTAIGAGP